VARNGGGGGTVPGVDSTLDGLGIEAEGSVMAREEYTK
jgi:hypothetical protein